MGATVRRAARVGAQDIEGPEHTHGVKLSGFVDSLVIRDAMRRFDLAIERDGTIEGLVLDALEIEGFEPGVPARFVLWLGRYTGQIRAGVLATLSPVLIATVRASELLLPQIAISAAPTRSSAYASLQQALGTRRRVSTGIQQTRPTPVEIARRKVSG